MSDIAELEKRIGVSFKNTDVLTQAVVHRSYLNEHPDFHLDHNERLEFLGDAVLELVVTEFLYKTYPNPEGELTNWRASLVNANMLAELADEIGRKKERHQQGRREGKPVGDGGNQKSTLLRHWRFRARVAFLEWSIHWLFRRPPS